MVPNPCLSLSKADNLAKALVRAKLKQYPDPPPLTTPINIKATKPKGNNVESSVANAVRPSPRNVG